MHQRQPPVRELPLVHEVQVLNPLHAELTFSSENAAAFAATHKNTNTQIRIVLVLGGSADQKLQIRLLHTIRTKRRWVVIYNIN
jgi:hypothetical protein